MRLFGVAGLGLVLSVGFAGAAAAQQPTIAVFTKNYTNPAYAAFRTAADKIGKATGARIIHFVPKKPDNVDEQTAEVEEALKLRPDIVVFTPVSDKAMVGPVKKLNDANIPIVLFTNALPGKFVTYVGSDDVDIGYREARYLFQKMGGKGNIVVIEGVPVAPTNRNRLLGYKRAFAEFPGIKVVGSAVGMYQQPVAREAMAKLLKEHDKIDAALVANDSMALGVLEAMQAANRSMLVMSINGIVPAVRAVGEGKILATVEFNMFKIGCLATQAAVRKLKGEPLPEKVMVPSEVITKDNYKAWLVPVAERSCPKWEDVIR